MFRARTAMLALVLLTVALAAPWTNIPRDNADSAGMLAHLRGHFIDADLLYDDDYRALRMTPTFAFVGQGGVVSNHWPTGATWLQAPGYGLGMVSARLLEAVGVGRASPFGVVPLLGVRAWALTILAACAVIVARWFRHFGPWGAGLAVGALIFGTPLYYYAAEAPLRPHLWGFAVTLLVVGLWRARDYGEGLTRTVLLAALCGLAACVRPQLAVLWLLAAEDVWRRPGGRGRQLAVSVAAFAAWPLLGARLQFWMYGSALLDYAGGPSHHLRAFLFSPYHGALLWCPVLLIGALALVVAVRGRQRGAWLIAIIVLHQLWVDASMRDIELYSVLGTRTWSGGNGFGPRKLVDVLPLFLPAVLYLCDRARARGVHRLLGALVLAATVPTILLHAAAFVAPDVTVGAVLDGPGLTHALSRALDGAAWSEAFSERSLPFSVALVVGLVVALPLTVGLLRCWRAVHGMDVQSIARLGAVFTLGGALVANLWLTVLLVRSDSLLVQDPERMQRAATALHPAHQAAVSRIADHHATLRAVLGEHAAPPQSK